MTPPEAALDTPTDQKDRTDQRAAIMRLFDELKTCQPDSLRRRELRDHLVTEHMNYARYVAGRFNAPRGSEDLEQVAYLALVKAVDRFDPDYGSTFLSYLTPMITGEIKRHFRDTSWDVHVPRRVQELSLRLRGATDDLSHRLGRSPTAAELATVLDATAEEIVEAMEAATAYTAASLDRPSVVDDADSAPLGELLGDSDPRFQAVIERESLKPLLARLPERDKQVLLMRFFRTMTQTEISVELGVSQMQVSRILTRILGELRQAVDDADAPATARQ